MTELALRLVFSLAVVVGLLLLIARVAGRKMRTQRGALVNVVHRQALTRTSAVSVVTVGSRVLVLGTTEQQVRLLTELDADDLGDAADVLPGAVVVAGALEAPGRTDEVEDAADAAHDWDAALDWDAPLPGGAEILELPRLAPVAAPAPAPAAVAPADPAAPVEARPAGRHAAAVPVDHVAPAPQVAQVTPVAPAPVDARALLLDRIAAATGADSILPDDAPLPAPVPAAPAAPVVPAPVSGLEALLSSDKYAGLPPALAAQLALAAAATTAGQVGDARTAQLALPATGTAPARKPGSRRATKADKPAKGGRRVAGKTDKQVKQAARALPAPVADQGPLAGSILAPGTWKQAVSAVRRAS